MSFRRAPGRRDSYAWWEYALMGLVAVVIIGGIILLVRVILSATDDSESASTPGASASAAGPVCGPGLWRDQATGSCVPVATCATGQEYDKFTNTCAEAAFQVVSVSPGNGSPDGDTSVTISGFGFQQGAVVTINGVETTDTVVVDDSTITTVTPKSKVYFPVDVVVTNPDGQSFTLDNGFIYDAPPPKLLDKVTPDVGSTQGGETVVIKGSDFTSDALVTFGGNPASDVVVETPDRIRAVTPPGLEGPVTVQVTNPGEEPASLQDGFTYAIQDPRTVTSVDPNQGSRAGGNDVTIFGSGFEQGARVIIGGNPASNVKVMTPNAITARTPAGAAGPADVQVRNPGQPPTTLIGGFTYVSAPAVSAISPRKGPTTGGTKVTISGSGFTKQAVVTWGNLTLSGVKVVSPSTIQITTPPAFSPITVEVSVTNPGEPTILVESGFTYVKGPAPKPSAAPSAEPTGPALPRCKSFTAPAQSTDPFTDLILSSELFAGKSVQSPVLQSVSFKKGARAGDYTWQDSPPRIIWSAPDASGESATLTYTYTSTRCSGTGVGTIKVSTR